MNPARFERLRVLFDACLDDPPAARAARIARLRAAEPDLADELEALLAADAEAASVLDEGLQGVAPGLEPQPGTVLDGRWRLVERLGEGGAGVVFRALGPDDAPVAVKCLRGDLLDSPRQVRRFRREFRAVARLRHPNLLAMHAEGLDRGWRYFVMEFAAHGDLSAHVGASPIWLLGVLIELCGALDHVHRHQIVHRDLKPENVLLTGPEGRTPKLADFGIVKLEPTDRFATGTLTVEGGLVGTVDYLSPEQVRRAPVDPRSDLYALGCMIHVLWTGRPPFEGEFIDRLSARVQQPAPSLAARLPQAPPDLVALTDQLLARDPDARPATALDVAAELAQVRAALAPQLASVTAAGRRIGAFLYAPRFAGRVAEVDTLVEWARARADGDGPALHLISGPAGRGKTALTRAFSERMSAAGWRVLLAGVRAGGDEPLAPFPALADQLGASIARDADPVRRGPRLALGGELQAVRAASDALRGAVDGALTARRLLIVLEDLHDADHDAIDLLRVWLQAPSAGLAVCATTRPEGHRRLARVAEGAAWLALTPLSLATCELLASGMLGASASALPAGLVEHLADEAGGNPLLIASAIRALVADGSLSRGVGGWALSTPARAGVASVLRRRLDALSATTREALAFGALLGIDFDVDLLRAVADITENQALDAIDEGVRAAVLRVDGPDDQVRFEHARLADALRESLADAEIRAADERAGAALEARGATASAVARHWGQSADAARAAKVLRAAAAEARAARDHANEGRLLRLAVARADEAGEVDLDAERERLADVLILTGDVAAGVDAYARALTADRPRVDRARLHRKRAIALLRSDATSAGLDGLRGALETLGDHTPRTRAGLIFGIGRDLLGALMRSLLPRATRTGGPLEERARLHWEMLFLYRWVDIMACTYHLCRFNWISLRLAHAEYRVDVRAWAISFFTFMGMRRLSLHHERLGRRLAENANDALGLARLDVMQAGADLFWRVDDVATLERIDRGLAQAADQGDAYFLTFALGARAWAQLMLGHLPAARADFTRVIDQANEAGTRWFWADALAGRATADVIMGRFDNAADAARRLLASPARLTFPAIEALATEVLGAEAYLRGRYREGLAWYDRAEGLYRRHDLYRAWGFLLPLQQFEALLVLADTDARFVGRAWMARLKKVARTARRRFGRLPLYAGCSTMLEGVIAARRGQTARARRLFAAAAATRPTTARTYLDTWMATRTALERHHIGDPPAEIAAALDACEARYTESSQGGLLHWLRGLRARLAV